MSTIIRGGDNFDSSVVGKVLQIATKESSGSSQVSTTSTGEVGTGFTLSITPIKANSKLYVSAIGYLKNGDSGQWGAVMVKNTTSGEKSGLKQQLGRDTEDHWSLFHTFNISSLNEQVIEIYFDASDSGTKSMRALNLSIMEIGE